ncbi:MAG: ribosome assembly cofactor RimP [Bacteroidetes bacterium]|nr:ribosome assembly cofactor RimP [Bacteroidota bacterium]
MTKLTDKLKTLVEQEAPAFGLFMVGHSSGSDGLQRFYVDSDEVLSMKALSDFSRHVSHLIDEGDFGENEFTFEVSSPGADKPLTALRQFNKHVGRTFEIVTTDDEKWEAKLTAVEGSVLQFEKTVKEKGKKPVQVTDSLPFENIQTATIKISFK